MKVTFSIITVTLNSKINLLKTIESVQEQNYHYYFHIIKDGLSNDQTNRINFKEFNNTSFYEFKDNGIYDAMNQAFKYASNEFIIYLNAGDKFVSKNTLSSLAKIIENNRNFNTFVGGTLQIDPIDKKIKRIIGMGLLYKFLPLAQLPHPSLIIKKSTLSKLIIPFDPKLKIAADYKQQLLLRKKNLLKIYYHQKIITIMPLGGLSNCNKNSIFNGYLETIICSFKIFKLLSFYIIFIKIILNLYSKLCIKKKAFRY